MGIAGLVGVLLLALAIGATVLWGASMALLRVGHFLWRILVKPQAY